MAGVDATSSERGIVSKGMASQRMQSAGRHGQYGRLYLALTMMCAGFWGDSTISWFREHITASVVILPLVAALRFACGYWLVFPLVFVTERKAPRLAGVAAVIIGLLTVFSGYVVVWLARPS